MDIDTGPWQQGPGQVTLAWIYSVTQFNFKIAIYMELHFYDLKKNLFYTINVKVTFINILTIIIKELNFSQQRDVICEV